MGVDIGNLYDRKPEEYYVSRPLALPEGTRPERIRWDASGAPGTGVKLQLRVAASRDALGGAAWRGPAGESSYYETTGAALATAPEAARWLQYRIIFDGLGVGSSSTVKSVEIQCTR
jgi:hypothetical protein